MTYFSEELSLYFDHYFYLHSNPPFNIESTSKTKFVILLQPIQIRMIYSYVLSFHALY